MHIPVHFNTHTVYNLYTFTIKLYTFSSTLPNPNPNINLLLSVKFKTKAFGDVTTSQYDLTLQKCPHFVSKMFSGLHHVA